jgi:hypothetical protein
VTASRLRERRASRREISLSLSPWTVGAVKLEVTGGSDKVDICEDQTGGDPLTGNDLEWDDRDPPEGQDNWAEKPSELWLEATGASGGPQGDSASLNYEGRTTVNTGGHTDGVTINCVQLKSIGFVDAGQGNGGDNEHPINRNSGDHGGWGLGSEVIPDPVWVADGPGPDTDPDVDEPVCYTGSVDEEGEENDVPSRLKVTVVVVAPQGASFSLAGKDGDAEAFRAEGLTGNGTEQSVSMGAAESYTLPPQRSDPGDHLHVAHGLRGPRTRRGRSRRELDARDLRRPRYAP